MSELNKQYFETRETHKKSVNKKAWIIWIVFLAVGLILIFKEINNQLNPPLTESLKTQIENLKDADKDTLIESNNKFKIDLDSLLNVQQNNHLAALRNGELSICCYGLLKSEILDIRIFKQQSEKYFQDNIIQDIKVYVFENSYIKEFYNSELNRLDIVYGMINSDKITLKNGLKIGMNRSELLGLVFKQSTIFDSINNLKVYENETGDYWTNYIFKNEKLVEIQYDSSYDWINRKLKK